VSFRKPRPRWWARQASSAGRIACAFAGGTQDAADAAKVGVAATVPAKGPGAHIPVVERAWLLVLSGL